MPDHLISAQVVNVVTSNNAHSPIASEQSE